MGKVALAVAVLFANACVQSSDVHCDDGRTCPEGTTCDDTRSLCLSAAQTTACNGIDDGKLCTAGDTQGICDRGFCEPGCGDGTTDPNEQCDDSNFASHDGCSSRCVVEVPTWIAIDSTWRGLTQHAAAYHAALGRTVVYGGRDKFGVSSRIWQRDPLKRASEPSEGWRDVSSAFSPSDRPPPLYGAAMAYDSARNVIVLFGGAVATGAVSYYRNETWEYAASTTMVDGEVIGTWRRVSTANTPEARIYSTMAFHPPSGKIVLFGGLGVNLLLDDTWTYDGTNWTQQDPQVIPPGRYRATMALDQARNLVVLYGGSAGAGPLAWEWNGTDWNAPSQGQTPGNRRTAALAYDVNRAKLVLFGGTITADPQTSTTDTWTYDGTWTRLPLSWAPPARSAPVLVTEGGSDALMMFGGAISDTDEPFSDVWELDASTWSNKTPRFTPFGGSSGVAAYGDNAVLVTPGLPSTAVGTVAEAWRYDGARWSESASGPGEFGLYGHAMVYDGSRFIVTGGACFDLQEGCEDTTYANTYTYAFDPATNAWSTIATQLPDRRYDVSAAYDAARHRTILFGGLDVLTGAPHDGTWSFDGTSWQILATGAGPRADGRPPMAYDQVLERVIVFDIAGDTWALGDNGWELLIAASSAGPVGRSGSALAYNPLRQRHVMLGGRGPNGESLQDVWELDTSEPAWHQVFVSGAGPLPRADFAFAMHDNARGMILLSGLVGSGTTRNDAWLLAYRSPTIDEDCNDNMDTDGDGQQDAEDPDCDPSPPQ